MGAERVALCMNQDAEIVALYMYEDAELVARAAAMCPHTTIYVSAYYYVSVLILLYVCPHTRWAWMERASMRTHTSNTHTTVYVSSQLVGVDGEPVARFDEMMTYADVC
jgi:hypothetical protein